MDMKGLTQRILRTDRLSRLSIADLERTAGATTHQHRLTVAATLDRLEHAEAIRYDGQGGVVRV